MYWLLTKLRRSSLNISRRTRTKIRILISFMSLFFFFSVRPHSAHQDVTQGKWRFHEPTLKTAFVMCVLLQDTISPVTPSLLATQRPTSALSQFRRLAIKSGRTWLRGQTTTASSCLTARRIRWAIWAVSARRAAGIKDPAASMSPVMPDSINPGQTQVTRTP